MNEQQTQNRVAVILGRMIEAVADNQNRIATMSSLLAKDLSDRIGEDPEAVTIACVTASLLLARLLASNHPKLVENGRLDKEGLKRLTAAYVSLVADSYTFDRLQ